MPPDAFDPKNTVPCSFCGGGGVMRETKTLTYIPIEDGEEGEPVEQRVIVGERCPACLGHGVIAIVGRRLDG